MLTTLIVEDEPTIMTLAEALIHDMGHQTLTAHNAIEALALVEGDAPIDLLFTDLNLGTGPTGLEFAQTARDLRSGLKVLYTSGQAMTDGMKTTMVEGSFFCRSRTPPTSFGPRSTQRCRLRHKRPIHVGPHLQQAHYP